jgi:hypothetical protein
VGLMRSTRPRCVDGAWAIDWCDEREPNAEDDDKSVDTGTGVDSAHPSISESMYGDSAMS